jgi:hypothetical protein
MTLSSFLFISALAMCNADSNITSYDLINDQQRSEANPILAPVAKGDSRYLYWVPVEAGLTLSHDGLKKIDPVFADIESVVIIGAELNSISTWSGSKASLGLEMALSEVECLLTAQILNVQF